MVVTRLRITYMWDQRPRTVGAIHPDITYTLDRLRQEEAVTQSESIRILETKIRVVAVIPWGITYTIKIQ